MVFSDTSTKTGLIQDVDFMVFGNSLDNTTAYPIADKTRNINRWYHQAVTWILQAQSDWDFDDINNSNFPIATTNLVANQQDYALPATAGIANDRVLQIQRVEVKYNDGNWYKAEPFDLGEKGSAVGVQADINNDFDATTPYYDVRYGSLFLYPVPTASVTGGLKIWFTRRITDIFAAADTTQEPGFDEQFHRLLSLGAAHDYLMSHDYQRSQSLRQEIELMRQDMQRFYGTKDKDRVLQFAVNKQNYK